MKSSIIAKSSIQLNSDRCAEMSRLYISMNLTKSRINKQFGDRSGGGWLLPISSFDLICFAKRSESQQTVQLVMLKANITCNYSANPCSRISLWGYKQQRFTQVLCQVPVRLRLAAPNILSAEYTSTICTNVQYSR